jgi:hypothetical protein
VRRRDDVVEADGIAIEIATDAGAPFAPPGADGALAGGSVEPPPPPPPPHAASRAAARNGENRNA